MFTICSQSRPVARALSGKGQRVFQRLEKTALEKVSIQDLRPQRCNTRKRSTGSTRATVQHSNRVRGGAVPPEETGCRLQSARLSPRVGPPGRPVWPIR